MAAEIRMLKCRIKALMVGSPNTTMQELRMKQVELDNQHLGKFLNKTWNIDEEGNHTWATRELNKRITQIGLRYTENEKMGVHLSTREQFIAAHVKYQRLGQDFSVALNAHELSVSHKLNMLEERFSGAELLAQKSMTKVWAESIKGVLEREHAAQIEEARKIYVGYHVEKEIQRLLHKMVRIENKEHVVENQILKLAAKRRMVSK